MVDDQVHQDAQPTVAGVADRLHDITEIAQPGVDAEVVGDVVAVVAIGARIHRHQPQARGSQVGDVLDPRLQPGKVATTVAVGVGERLDVKAVDDGVLPP